MVQLQGLCLSYCKEILLQGNPIARKSYCKEILLQGNKLLRHFKHEAWQRGVGVCAQTACLADRERQWM